MEKKQNQQMDRFELPHKKFERKDYSPECTVDDDHDEHCWSCTWFVFPIGCMKGEEELLEKLDAIKPKRENDA